MVSLIADCGSTKVEWAVIDTDLNTVRDPKIARQPSVIRTTGFNAAVTPADEIAAILDNELICALEGDSIKVEDVARLHFYGAGCIGGEVDKRLESLLIERLPNATIEIAGDLLAAARALFDHDNGIACILGTGSNMGLYDGAEITHNTPPMGFILGDEGSGAVLGRTLINHVFKHPGYLPDEIIADFNATYSLSKADIIERVYRQPAPNRFLASFCPFLKKHLSHPAIHRLVADSFTAFLSANLPPDLTEQPTKDLSGHPTKTRPIGFVGSVAHHFAPVLTQVCTAAGFPAPHILQSPLPALITYHTTRQEASSLPL